MKEEDENTISMVELDRELSKSVKRARKRPLLVTKRKKAWVWVVAHEVWTRERQYMEYIPATHPLMMLRDLADTQLSAYVDAVHKETASLDLHIDPEVVCRALCLYVLYSSVDTRRLWERIGRDMLFRRFVGVDSSGPLWPFQEFDEDIHRLIATRAALELVDSLVSQRTIVPQFDGEFCVNQALLEEWKSRLQRASAAGGAPPGVQDDHDEQPAGSTTPSGKGAAADARLLHGIAAPTDLALPALPQPGSQLRH